MEGVDTWEGVVNVVETAHITAEQTVVCCRESAGCCRN